MSNTDSDNRHISVPSNPQQEVIQQLLSQINRLETQYKLLEARLKILENFVTVGQYFFPLKSLKGNYYSFDVRILYRARTWEYVALCDQFPSISFAGKSSAKVSYKMKEELLDIVNDLEENHCIVPQ